MEQSLWYNFTAITVFCVALLAWGVLRRTLFEIWRLLFFFCFLPQKRFDFDIGSSSLSAHYSPLLDIGLSNLAPSHSISGYSHPAVLRKSSLHLAWGRPTLRLPRRSLHSRTRLPQRLSLLRLIWPAHCHFRILIRCAMSVTSSLPDHLVSDSNSQRNTEHNSFHSSLCDPELAISDADY
jgi:hypothetical protein